jgi:hypothetical protein
MRFDLVRPCADCPFRSDRRFPLRRAGEIAEGIFAGDLTFTCHNTLRPRRWRRGRPRREEQHCAGALILHERLGRPNWRIRFAHYLGLYDPDRLDMHAPVVRSIAEFLAQSVDTAG